MTYPEICALRAMGISKNGILSLGKNIKGQSVNSINGTQEYTIQIPGSAKVFMGFAVVSPNENNNTTLQFSIMLNNELIVDRVDLGFCSPDDRSLQPNGYVECIRRLTGKDVLKFAVNGAGIVVLQAAFYYMSGFGRLDTDLQPTPAR